MRISYDGLFAYLFKNNITSSMVSKKSGVSRNTIAKMKNGEPVHLNAILAICEAYNLKLSDVIKIIEE